MNVMTPRAHPALSLAPVFLLLGGSVFFLGCVSPKYKMAPEKTPPPAWLNLAATQPLVEGVVNTVISYQGPGSWKRAAYWDEYVVTISNQGDQPLAIASAALTDFAGTSHAPGVGIQALEKRSTTLEQKCLDAVLAFARDAGPAAVTVGGGVRLVGVTGGALGAGVGLAAAVAVVPVPYDYDRKTDKWNKRLIVTEFNRRRLALPLTLAPGEARVGSLFFPMVPNPRSLSLHWSGSTSGGELTLPLESVHGLHVRAPAPAGK